MRARFLTLWQDSTADQFALAGRLDPAALMADDTEEAAVEVTFDECFLPEWAALRGSVAALLACMRAGG